MKNQNNDKKENNHKESIHNHFNISPSNKTDFQKTPYLYGMSLEQYNEGLKIHSKFFSQLEKVKRTFS